MLRNPHNIEFIFYLFVARSNKVNTQVSLWRLCTIKFTPVPSTQVNDNKILWTCAFGIPELLYIFCSMGQTRRRKWAEFLIFIHQFVALIWKF